MGVEGRVKDLATCSILGFVFVSSVNVNDRVVHLVTPQGGDLPGTILLKGKISWNEKEWTLCLFE